MPFWLGIGPLIRPGAAKTSGLGSNDPLTEADFVVIDQFADLEVSIELNEARTGRVSLSVFLDADDGDGAGSLISNLAPWEFCTRVGYLRPGETNALGETVIMGPSNFSVNYETGRLDVELYDPAIKMQHHYLRYWDPVLDDSKDPDKGTVTIDFTGARLLRDAAEISAEVAGDSTTEYTRNVPMLGVGDGYSHSSPGLEMGVERGQEVWSLIQQIARHVNGPDIDLCPAFDLPTEYYAYLDCFDDLGRDLTATVHFNYGVGDTEADDTCVGLRETNGRPTNYAHVWDSANAHRRTAGSRASANRMGVWPDWLSTDIELRQKLAWSEVELALPNAGFKILDTEPLYELARARVRAYSGPPKFVEVELRPDAAQEFFFGHPDFVDRGSTVGDFYLGDRITINGERGHRSLTGSYRITGVTLKQDGSNGLTTTLLRVIPSDVEADEEEEQ